MAVSIRCSPPRTDALLRRARCTSRAWRARNSFCASAFKRRTSSVSVRNSSAKRVCRKSHADSTCRNCVSHLVNCAAAVSHIARALTPHAARRSKREACCFA
eukprot:1320524-Pleurochrysis_carterae.AAC.1